MIEHPTKLYSMYVKAYEKLSIYTRFEYRLLENVFYLILSKKRIGLVNIFRL